jgi:AcrR family transcriptional regulator
MSQPGENVTRENKRQRHQHLVRKLVQGKAGPEAIAALLGDYLEAGQPQEVVLDELVGCFLEMRDAFKQKMFPAQYSLPGLIAVFQREASNRDIPAEQFYSKLLEKTVFENEPGDDHKASAKLATRERVLEAALGVFSEKGFHVATMDEVAERAHVGKGTLYRYFANKEALFNELVRQRLAELEGKARAILDSQDDVLTMITKYVRIYFEFFDHNQHLYRLIVQEHLDVGVQVQGLYLKQVKRRIPVLKRKVYEAGRAGLLKPLDFETVFYGVMGFIHGTIQKWLAHDCSYSLAEELPGVLEVLFYGFVNGSRVESNVICPGGKNGSERNAQKDCGHHC